MENSKRRETVVRIISVGLPERTDSPLVGTRYIQVVDADGIHLEAEDPDALGTGDGEVVDLGNVTWEMDGRLSGQKAAPAGTPAAGTGESERIIHVGGAYDCLAIVSLSDPSECECPGARGSDEHEADCSDGEVTELVYTADDWRAEGPASLQFAADGHLYESLPDGTASTRCVAFSEVACSNPHAAIRSAIRSGEND